MTHINFIKSSGKREIIKELNEKLGIIEIPHLLIQSGKEKIRGYTGILSKDEIAELGELIHIDNIGLYFMKREKDGLRLSFDAVQALSNQITKNIVDITEEQLNKWIRGNDLEMKAPIGLVAIRHNGDFFGCGKSNGEKIFNHVPKERRLKKPLS
jgi:NOL1/NOP2/fmu family ribosome biogenesis protein